VACDDGSLAKDSPLLKWNQLLVDASDKLGCRLDTALHYNKQLQEAGFLNVVEHRFKWPMNTWPKDKEAKLLGRSEIYNYLDLIKRSELLTNSVLQALGYTKTSPAEWKV